MRQPASHPGRHRLITADTLPYPYAGPHAFRASILTALHRVVDPELALTIVDVGLIYGIDVDDQRIHAAITMTSAACPVTDVILDDVEDELGKLAGPGMRVEVELVWEPPWTPERMSARAKAFMGW